MFTTRPELTGTFGMVASTHWLGSAVGMAVLERGGNAFDAAGAMAFVLQVAEPHMCGPGGDVPVMFARGDGPAAERHRVQVLCGQGPAPSGATIGHYRSEGLDLIPATGLLAAVVPGATPTWLTLLRDHGTWPLADVLAFAIGYAEQGCPVHPDITATVARSRHLFEANWPSSVALWLPDGQPPAAGTLYNNPELAATWRQLLVEAHAGGASREAQFNAALRAWSEGFVAEAIDRHAAVSIGDGIGGHYGGVLTGADMARWKPTYEDPITMNYEGVDIAKCGPWSQGPVLLQSLALLAGTDVASLDPAGTELVHLIAEVMKLSYADRETFYGDPAFVEVPLTTLLSPAYNDVRRALLGPRASRELRPGTINGYGKPIDYDAAIERGIEASQPRSRTMAAEPTAALAASANTAALAASANTAALAASANTVVGSPPGGDTVHLDVVDRWGNMVSATPSGGWLQASPAIAGLGFALGSRAQIFSLDEYHPNGLAPGKRPRTTLTPSLVSRDGKPWMAFGSPGGDGQDQWQLLFLLRVLHHGWNLQEAIDAPSFHSDHCPNSFWPHAAYPARLMLESRFDTTVVEQLRRCGHDVVVAAPWSEGRLSAVTRRGDGMLAGGANARGMQGYAVGR